MDLKKKTFLFDFVIAVLFYFFWIEPVTIWKNETLFFTYLVLILLLNEMIWLIHKVIVSNT